MRSSAGGDAPTPKPAATVATPILGEPGNIRFEDVTEKAGLRFATENYKTPSKYMVETMGFGGAFLDYDGDGWQDIVLVSGAPLPGSAAKPGRSVALFRNNHDGTFADRTVQAGLGRERFYAMGVAAGDYDNDGRTDFYVSGVLGRGRLYHNEGGRFREVALSAGVENAGKWGTSCAWFDYDNDSRLDLFVCNYVKYASLKDDLPCEAGGGMRTYCIPSAYDDISSTLYHNEGSGRFRDVTKESGVAEARAKGLGVAVWDYDDDGRPDLFVASDTVPGLLLHNEGGGKFRDLGLESGVAVDTSGSPHSGMGIDIDDVHGDGSLRLAITNYQAQQTSFYKYLGSGLFEDERHNVGVGEATANVLGFGVLFADFDNDGRKDLFQVNGHVQDDIGKREPNVYYEQSPTLLQNTGGTFRAVGIEDGPLGMKMVGRGCARGDFDNDGREDIVLIPNHGPVRLWRNVSLSPGNWISIQLTGAKSNRNGIGAQVRVTANRRTLRTVVRSGSSYLSQGDIRAHFGVGRAETVDVEVRWPSGMVDEVASVKVGKVYRLKEGSARLEAQE